MRQEDDQRISKVMARIGFERHDLKPMVLFTDPDEPSKRSGVHLVWADTLIRPSYVCPSPSVNESVRHTDGYRVLDLTALVRMKLTSNRDIDRVHIRDLLEVGLIDSTIASAMPAALRERLESIKFQQEEDGE